MQNLDITTVIPLLFGVIVLLIIFLVIVNRIFVNVGAREIAIKERRYLGAKMPPGRVVATEGEVGIQADVLKPGLHLIKFPFEKVVRKVPLIEIGADFDQRDFAYYFLKRKLDEVQARLQHVGLNTDFAFRGDHSSRRHFRADVPSFFNRDFSCTDVDEDPVHDNEEGDQKNECYEKQRDHSCDFKIWHGLSLSNSTGGS